MKKTVLILVAIIAFAFIVRTLKITESPLYGDELTAVLDAEAILKTGMDQTGKSFPVTFSMRGGSPPGYIYFSVPFVWLFGPTALGIRAASLTSGILIVLLMYLIAKKMFREKEALFVAFLAAITPWGINLSRGGFETNLALALSLGGVTLFLYSHKKPINWLLGAICFGLAIFTYPTYKLTIPLFSLLLYWYLGGKKFFFNKSTVRYFVGTAVIVLAFLGLLISEVFLGHSEGRFLENNVFAQPDLRESITQKINLERSIDTLGPTSILFHNKAVEYFNELKGNYFSYYSFPFLFLKGDGNPRHNMTQTGVLYLVEFAFILSAIYLFAIKKQDIKMSVFLLSWLAISPIAGALLGETHALRASFMLPPLLLVSGAGLTGLATSVKGFGAKAATGILILGLLIQLVFMLERLYFVSPSKFANFWSYPAKKATEIALENRDKYDYVILSDRIQDIEYAFPVYARIDAQDVIQQNIKKATLGNRDFKKFGNVYIGNVSYGSDTEELLKSIKGNYLLLDNYLTGSKDFPSSYVVSSLDNVPVLVVIEK